jgi:protoheme IX farnesyltransferase
LSKEDAHIITDKPISAMSDVVQFTKFRLASLVVLSAVLCYLLATNDPEIKIIFLLTVGGFLVTASSNGFNQIIEKELDRLMSRTMNRPLPSGRMSVNTAYIISFSTGILGLILLSFINLTSVILGFLALLSYVWMYTPYKQKSPFAVFIGAFPGAIPPMLGWVAASGKVDAGALICFAIQFIWQFPHFWAIAWVLDDDYKKAGFKLLPSGNRDKSSAFQTFVYSSGLIPLCMVPYYFHIAGITSAILCVVISIAFAYQAFKLLKYCDIKSARTLMFASFIYLPLVQLILVLDKI